MPEQMLDADGSPTRSKGEPPRARSVETRPTKILAIDIGGTKIKALATGHTEAKKAPSGKGFTPAKMVERVRELAADWDYDAVSIGVPALVGHAGPKSEPGNLGCGWVGFDYAAAFERQTTSSSAAATPRSWRRFLTAFAAATT